MPALRASAPFAEGSDAGAPAEPAIMEEPASNEIGLLKEIFFEALERTDARERRAFMDSACGRDLELRRRVEELLKELDSTDCFLEQQVWSTAGKPDGRKAQDDTEVMPPSEQIGDRVGNYELVKKLGEGGCGVVYVARQEEPLRREVALKVIRLGTDSRQVISRFEAERQTLALMDHPNIAKVFDAGTTQAGRPFFVMELIKGRKLTEHCNQNRLGLQERLRLFIQVCLGVQHAHQKGIIHRDIKPSNILIADHDGQVVPKIIDFGIAMAIDQSLPASQRTLGSAQLIGTPAYMSPEQASASGDVDTRSDIYSLGLILHELLTGWAPLPASALLDRVWEPERAQLSTVEPIAPSIHLSALSESDRERIAEQRRLSPARLIKMTRGDLDCIVMKALERDRTRRYASASAFAQDIECFLAEEPVRARPATRFYRFQKLARRHRPIVAALTGAAFVLLVSAGVSAWLALRAKDAETQARLSGQMEAQLRREAVRARERAETQADLARLNEYVADVNLAQQSLESGNYGRAVQLLRKHLPQPHRPDLRGFEWRYLWQLSHGDEHSQIPVQDAPVRMLTVSPTSRWLAIVTDNNLTLWDLPSRILVHTFPKHVISAVFSGQDRELIMSAPEEVDIVNLTTWAETNLVSDESGVLSISKDGSQLAMASREGVRLWDTRNWTAQKRLPGAFAPMAFSPDNSMLATGGREGITLWGLTNSTARLLLKNSRNVFRPRRWDQLGSAMTFSADGRYLVAPRNFPSEHGLFVMSLWDVQSGEEVGVLPQESEPPEHTGTIACLALGPDGRTLATVSMDHSIRLWDLSTRRIERVLHGHLSEVWSVAFSPDGSTMFTGAKDGSVDIWTMPPKPKNDLLEGSFVPLAFSNDSRVLAALDEEKGSIVFVDSLSKSIKNELRIERRSFRSPARYALSADFKILAAAHRNHVSLYNTLSRERVELETGEAPVFELALSPDGSQLVTGAFGGAFQWWNLANHSKSTLGNEVRRALFSPDGKLLLLISDQRGELWDVAKRCVRTVLASDSRLGPAAAFSPNGRWVAIGSSPMNSEQAITVWEVGTGRMLGACIGHKQGIMALGFSADSRTLASASNDSTLKFWNIATLQQLTSFTIPGDAHNPVFSPDGTLLVIGQSLQQKGLRFFPGPPVPEREIATQNVPLP